MTLPSNTKIENRAIGALQSIVDDDLTMDSKFNSMDKEMAWDGYITIFKQNNGDQSKKNYDAKIPVQIKGHIDKEEKYIRKKRISYSVDLEDLKIYFNDFGVLYFEIFMSEDGKYKEIFYSSLYPSKIKYFLERAEKKGNKQSISIPFIKLEKTSQSLYIVLKQFSTESKRQGSGTNEIVQNTIPLKDRDRITSMTATAVGASNEFEFLQKLATGDVCFYASTEENQIKVPIEWTDSSKYYLNKEIDINISIDGKVYYRSCKISMSSEEEMFLIMSDNLQFDLINSKFKFDIKSNINDLNNDSKFLLNLFETEQFCIGETEYPCKNINVTEDFKLTLDYFIILNKVLNEINFKYEKRSDTWTQEIKEQLLNLVKMKKGLFNHNFTEKVHIYNWKIEDKYMPLIVVRGEDGGLNRMNGAVLDKSLRTSITNDDNDKEFFVVPIFAYIDWEVMKNLYTYDYDAFYEQIDVADINELTINEINHAALKLISAYDANGDERLLEIADYYFEKLKELEKGKEYFLINQMQIKYRLGELDEEDVISIKSIKIKDPQIIFAKNILLKEKKKAQASWKKLSKEDKAFIKEYPIYTLYKNMHNK